MKLVRTNINLKLVCNVSVGYITYEKLITIGLYDTIITLLR
jgi:hypothetical protein